MTNTTYRTSVVLRTLVALTSLAAAAVTHAQSATVTAANASNDVIYAVTFNPPGGSTTVLNTDGGSLHHIVSLVFLTNPGSDAVDLLAADNQGGIIVRYPGDFQFGGQKFGTPIPLNGTGPAYPDGLSVDGVADLYVVNSAPGNGASNPQLWVLPSDGMGGFTTPQLIDALPGFNSVYSSYVSTEMLVDTLVVTTTITPAGGQPVVTPGDVLVATSNPSQVLRYAATNGPIPAAPTVLVTLPAGATPGGLAFWPLDNTLLVSTSRGTIYQYDLTTGNQTIFANNLGNGQFKVRTGTDGGIPYAYVANNNGGDILQFAGPQINGQNQLRATVTSGVQHPQGLAVTNSAYAPISTCNPKCDLFGNRVLTHSIPFSPAGNVVEDICIVAVDPRVPAGTCATSSLPVSQVCGSNFSSTAFIPAGICAASGPKGQSFALIKTLSKVEQTHPDTFNGNLIANDSNLQSVLPGPANAVCNAPASSGLPLDTLLWAPLSSKEGIIAEGNALVDISDGCDVGGHSFGFSLFAIGVAPVLPVKNNVPDLTQFVTDKYTNLNTTIGGELGESPPALPPATPPSPAQADGNFTYQLQQCIKTSGYAFAAGAAEGGAAGAGVIEGAANDAIAANKQIGQNLNQFTQDADYPNPSGAIRWRLQNIWYTIDTRINGNLSNPPTTTEPPASPPALQSPTITGTPAQSVVFGNPYFFQPGAQNFWQAPPSDNLTFSITGQLPAWLSFNMTTGVLSGIAPNKKGTSGPFVITVTDGCATASLTKFTITVTNK